MSSIYDEAVGLLSEIQNQTEGLKTGLIPSIPELLYLQGKLVGLYHRLGEQQAQKFSAKEAAYINRKCEAARLHRHGRVEMSMTSKDAETSSLLAIKQELKDELETVTEWEHHRILRDSLGRAFDHLQQCISTIKFLENKPS